MESPGYSPHPEVLEQRIGDEMVLVHLSTERIYELNQTGARLWELLREVSDPQILVERLRTEFDAQDDEVEPEVQRALTFFAEEELILVRKIIQGPSADPTA